MRYTLLTYHENTISGTTIGDPSYSWSLRVVEGEEFCKAVASSGRVGTVFSLKFFENSSEDMRSAKVRITFSDGYTNTFSIRQLAKTENPDYDRAWAEQPYHMPIEDYIHKTYYTVLSDGTRVRNFSVCYDTDKICARWVAYPAHSTYTSGRNYDVGGDTQGRTNAWAFDDAVTRYKSSSSWSTAYEFVSKYDSQSDAYDTATDPVIPHSKQADIRFNNGIGGGYARGHMLPSADRYNTWNTNAQTCYSTNIMAQNYDFNSASWGTLENKVRNKVCADTLYVVVGTLFEDSKRVTNNTKYNKNGQSISQTAHCSVAVPSHCFKLLLRTKSGSTRKHISDITSADELMCIGFLFENNNGAKGAQASLSSAAVSVSEIEQRSGFIFFRNLNPAIADKVKSQCNFSQWNF